MGDAGAGNGHHPHLKRVGRELVARRWQPMASKVGPGLAQTLKSSHSTRFPYDFVVAEKSSSVVTLTAHSQSFFDMNSMLP